ncbi:MAG: hypothetical protein P8Y39_05150 [Nitrospirota bacterium]
MRHAGFLIGALLFLLVGMADAARVTVEVTNGTSGEPMASHPLSLSVGSLTARGDFEARESRTVKTDDGGVYSGSLDVAPGEELRARAVHRGISYSAMAEASGNKDLALSLPVYEITDHREGVSVEERSMYVVPKGERFVQVYETLTVVNRGTKTYVGKWSDDLSATQVLFIPMPKYYMLTSLEGIPQGKALTAEKGIVTLKELKPGTHRIALGYFVQSDTGRFDLSLLSAPGAPETRSLVLAFSEEKGWNLKAGGLTRTGLSEAGGRAFRVYKGSPGSAAHITLYGPSYVNTAGIWSLSVGLLFLASLAGVVLLREPGRRWSLRRERRRLEALLERFDEEAREGEVRRYYHPFAQVLRERLREIEQRYGA